MDQNSHILTITTSLAKNKQTLDYPIRTTPTTHANSSSLNWCQRLKLTANKLLKLIWFDASESLDQSGSGFLLLGKEAFLCPYKDPILDSTHDHKNDFQLNNAHDKYWEISCAKGYVHAVHLQTYSTTYHDYFFCSRVCKEERFVNLAKYQIHQLMAYRSPRGLFSHDFLDWPKKN